ncbi:hypothetical protein IKM56_04745 [Candidatus Saccharibacteria bacterium]|nr:hypothetical protein [Candidatus Saccharibacteria bacterium]
MKASAKIDSEMNDAKARIRQLIVRHKYDTDEFDMTGMICERDALIILKGTTSILRKALESIIKDYHLSKKQVLRISKHIDDIKDSLKQEISSLDIIDAGCGVYMDRFGRSREVSYEDAYREFEQKLNSAISTLDIQKLRLDNYRIRKAREERYSWLPILISFGSLTISIASLIFQIIWSK